MVVSMRREAWLVVMALSAALVRCSHSSDAPAGPPRRDCYARVWARPSASGAAPQVAGVWAGWVPQAMTARDDGWLLYSARLPPGEYGYVLVDGGAQKLDPLATLSTFVGDVEVSAVTVEDCAVPAVRVDDVRTDDAVTVRATFVSTGSGTPVEATSVKATLDDGTPVPVTSIDPSTGAITAAVRGLSPGKHAITLKASDADGKVAEAATATAFVGAPSWDDGVLYQIVIDRFRGDGGAALPPPKNPGARAGGTLDGVRAELEKGTFAALGVTALWLSPVYTNPDEARPGRDGHLYEGYHGYWPAQPRTVDPHLGGETALRAVIDAAHRRGIRVLFDLVPNHVYETSPRYTAHVRDGWFHDGPSACVCGDPGCGWGERMESCWFTSYLPDVRQESADAQAMIVDDAAWWARTFDADGVRIDAVPMMPRSSTRRVAAALREQSGPSRASLVLGEVYTGPGAGGLGEIRYHLGPHGLDGAFDFPLMWALRDAIGTGDGGFDSVETLLATQASAFAGSGTIIPRILGNHDTSRFLSYAAGDDDGDPWTSPPAQAAPASAFARHELALITLMTLPGLPVLYYGDEVALAGAGDPDSRRVLPGDTALSPSQAHALALTKRLGALRTCKSALRRAPRTPLVATADTWAYARGDVVIAISTKTAATTLALTTPAGTYVDALDGTSISLPGPVPLAPLGGRVLVPAGDACVGHP
jgi:glycosidase